MLQQFKFSKISPYNQIFLFSIRCVWINNAHPNVGVEMVYFAAITGLILVLGEIPPPPQWTAEKRPWYLFSQASGCVCTVTFRGVTTIHTSRHGSHNWQGRNQFDLGLRINTWDSSQFREKEENCLQKTKTGPAAFYWSCQNTSMESHLNI